MTSVHGITGRHGVETKPSPPPKVGISVGNLAPGFALPSYRDDNLESPNDGSMVALSDFQGKKRVMANFWSTHCGGCIVEFPLIRAVYDEHGKNSGDLAVVAVCIDGREDRIAKIIRKYDEKYGPFDFPILVDKQDIIKDSYHIWAVPMTFFMDSEGIIRHIKIGRFDSREEIEGIIESL